MQQAHQSFENDDKRSRDTIQKIHWRHEGRRELSSKDEACTWSFHKAFSSIKVDNHDMRSIEMQLGCRRCSSGFLMARRTTPALTLHDSYFASHTVLTNQACCTVEEVELFQRNLVGSKRGAISASCRQPNGGAVYT